MSSSRIAIDVYLDEAGALATMADDVRRGLTRTPKQLPPKYFYDERGSWLFERITRLPEYYPTRAETRLLEATAPEIAAISRPEELVELGPGSATKTRLLLEACRAAGRLRRYVPVEVSAAMVEHAGEHLLDTYPWLEIHAVVGDFRRHLRHVPPDGDRLVAFLGGTIGNLVRAEAVEFLKELVVLLPDGQFLLLGTDLQKDRKRLEAAYNDDRGVTAEFNRNVLHVINRQLDADFDPDAFEHVAFYNDEAGRIEMHLEAQSHQVVHVSDLDLTVSFDEGERMRTEVSCKYTRQRLESMLSEAGLELTDWFTDPDEEFALSLSVPRA